MRDQHEQDTWDQDEVEIVDLGAPNSGLGRYFLTLGEKWRTTAHLRARLIATVIALGLLIAVLQPVSSGVNTSIPGGPHTAPTYSIPSTIYIIDCVSIISTGGPLTSHGQPITWQQLVSSPAQGCNSSSRPGSQCSSLMPQQLPSALPTNQEWTGVCSVGTPLPAPSGNPGKSR